MIPQPQMCSGSNKQNPEIIPSLSKQLEAGIDRARISLYAGIDCNDFFPKLLTSWERSSAVSATLTVSRSNPVSVSQRLQESISKQHDRDRTIEGDNFALSQRDSGNAAEALEYFLQGRPLGDVMNPDELDEGRGGSHYGNIGRCLHFMGQTKGALTCYQKSALLLEKSSGRFEMLNRGYIRWWIGELLLARGQKKLASTFIEAGRRRWEGMAPALSRQLAELQEKLTDSLIHMSQPDRELEETCRNWILGEYLDDLGAA